jgi:segregation and condensation protein B
MLEALLFASAVPLAEEEIAARIPEGVDVEGLLFELQAVLCGRGRQPAPHGRPLGIPDG